MQLGTLKNIAETAEAFVTALALLVGGFWTYLLFVRRREKFPRATISHAVLQKALGSGHLVHVEARLANTGQVLLQLERAETRLYHLDPRVVDATVGGGGDPVGNGKTEFEWPLIAERTWEWKAGSAEVEPGEIESLHSEFVVSTSIDSVAIYTYVPNCAKRGRDIGWSVTTFLELGTPESKEEVKYGGQSAERTQAQAEAGTEGAEAAGREATSAKAASTEDEVKPL